MAYGSQIGAQPGEEANSREAGGRKPVVLLATAERWNSTARLALGLQSLGCDPVLLSPGDHPAAVCGAASRCFRYDPLRPLHSLRHALRLSQPAVVLPADETVACQLGELWSRSAGRSAQDTEALAALITRSLGDPQQLRDAGARMLLHRAAEAEGVPTPQTLEIAGAQDLAVAFGRLGSPLVLKADASSGGRGVRVVLSGDEAQRAYRAFSMAPHMPRAVLRGLLHRDWTHVRSSARRERHGVSAQRMVEGVERTAMALAVRGEVLVIENFEVVHTWKEHGPSSVLRRVDDPRMDTAIRALTKRLNLTGFSGFDFIVDKGTGELLLLERNARPTQLAHLSFGAGHDLLAAYVRSIVGIAEVEDRPTVTTRELIALFPHEMQRDPESPELQEAFHDVPWESPALLYRALRGDPALQAALGKQQKRARWAHESGSVPLRVS